LEDDSILVDNEVESSSVAVSTSISNNDYDHDNTALLTFQ
jgi:hypothetical protein